MRLIFILLALAAIQYSRADVIECDNGDRYNGKVLSMDEKLVKLQNEIAGTLTIPRNRIVSISFKPVTKAAVPASQSTTNRNAIQPGQQIKIDSAAIDKVQTELLSTATPEANQMFQEMVRGLQTGQLNLSDIRAQAETTLKELRELQEGLGDDDTAGLLNAYGSILENFIRQGPRTTNAPKVAVPKTPVLSEEE